MSIRTAFVSGRNLKKVNRTLRRHGYPTAGRGYLANIVDAREPGDVAARRKLWGHVSRALDAKPPDAI